MDRQQDLLKNIVGIKPKRPKVSSPSQPTDSNKPKHTEEDLVSELSSSRNPLGPSHGTANPDHTAPRLDERTEVKQQNRAGSLLGLAYESSDEE